MPERYHCKACKVVFVVGRGHYHGSQDGFWGYTHLVCSACGTGHMVEHPDLVRIPVLGGLFSKEGKPKKPDRLMAEAGPQYKHSAEPKDSWWLESDWKECKISHELCPKSKYAFMKDFLDLQGVKCNHCGRADALVKEWGSFNVRCPQCGLPELYQQASWIT